VLGAEVEFDGAVEQLSGAVRCAGQVIDGAEPDRPGD
jgi:hypothetical protein